ncbi:hypothetical protein [Mycolicibacterium sp.]|uniref:hypothetical protein n=1 Tax=Mycolicibacterium sp. TaxID=2320850 RepID=UPI0037CC0033|nr:hypothetical protein [Mycobacterium sp. DSM 3803]
MELHDDPQQLTEDYVSQHARVFGEVHGDLIARYGEVPDRFVDQGANVRPITTSCAVLETVLFSRLRRQTADSTLKAVSGNGFGIRLLDGNGTQIGVRKHPRKWDGSLLGTVPYVPGGEQFSIEDELGHPIGGEDGIAEPQGYRLYVLWWPGSVGFGGAAFAAGILTKSVKILYGRTLLPPPIMEERVTTFGPGGGPGGPGARRRDDDFAEVDEDAAGEQDEEDGPPKSS